MPYVALSPAERVTSLKFVRTENVIIPITPISSSFFPEVLSTVSDTGPPLLFVTVISSYAALCFGDGKHLRKSSIPAPSSFE